MRTLAAAMSASCRDLVDVLYSKTRRLLEEYKQAEARERSSSTYQGLIHTEYIQAWLLLAHYESLRVNEWQAMLTAGYAFRLIQLARLHEIDGPKMAAAHTMTGPEPKEDFAVTEERRRTFWVAYNLDCFLSWGGDWPLTLYEEMVFAPLKIPGPTHGSY